MALLKQAILAIFFQACSYAYIALSIRLAVNVLLTMPILTQYICISVQAVPCGDECRCHYNITQRTNIFTCFGPQYTALPEIVPGFTNWIDFIHTKTKKLCGSYDYLKKPRSNITHLNLMCGQIKTICDTSLNEILQHSNVKSFNLANNKLARIPDRFNKTTGNLKELWLGGNPVQCDCDMLWLIYWLNNTRVSGQRLVQDYQDVLCMGGKWNGTAVYKLNQVKMGCYPKKVATWIIVASSVIGSLLLFTDIVILIMHRKWNAVRWIIYKNFDKLLGNPDRNKDLDNTEFDAFLSFWYVIPYSA